MQKESLIVGICDFVTKYSIYALIFLLPIFFMPQTSDVLDFNKQALLFLLVFISLFALMLRILINGRFEVNKNSVHIVVGSLFLVYLLATVFSVYRYGSFWGQPQQTSESMLTAICLILFYFLVSNVLSRKDILTSVVVFSFSASIVELIGVFQLFNLFIIPFDFAKSTAFNLIGPVDSLGIFAAIVFPLATVLLIIVKKWWRIIFGLEIVLSALILILINYHIIWWLVFVGCIFTLVLGITKRDLFDGRWMALPMFFLAVSLFFVLLNPQISWLPQKPQEILLTQKAGLDIAISSTKASPVLGSGLGTFAYDYLKFKSPDFSQTSFWNITLNNSSSKVLNDLTTTGILGLLVLLALMALPAFYGMKFFILKKDSGDQVDYEEPAQIYSILLLGLYVVLIEQSIAYFLYNSNITLDFIYFFAIGALIGIISENKKEYTLKPSSLLTLLVTFIFTLVFIFGLGLLALGGQRYVAEINYKKGLADFQSGRKAEGTKELELAASLNSQSDLYFKQLSQAYLLSIQDELKSVKSSGNMISEQEKAKVQSLVSNSMNAGKMATNINPKSADNWSALGYVYQNLFGISGDTSSWALSSYDSALKLDPNNPYLYYQEGNVYMTQASNLPSISAAQKSQLLSAAQSKLEKSVALNPYYSNALYSLGLVYDSLGQTDKAINVFTRLQQLNPTSPEVTNMLNILEGKLYQPKTNSQNSKK